MGSEVPEGEKIALENIVRVVPVATTTDGDVYYGLELDDGKLFCTNNRYYFDVGEWSEA